MLCDDSSIVVHPPYLGDTGTLSLYIKIQHLDDLNALQSVVVDEQDMRLKTTEQGRVGMKAGL